MRHLCNLETVKTYEGTDLGISAILLAVGLGALSIIFTGLAYDHGWSGGSACTMAESLCRRPSLMAIPVFATMAWGMTDR